MERMWARRPGRARGLVPELEALYRVHFGLVWALVARYGVRATHREDVVQEVWLTVHRRLASFDRDASAAHWIAGVTRFVAWRHVRATVRAHRKLEALQAIGRTELEDPIVDRETVAVVTAALAALEPMFRDAVVSVEIEGWSGPEAAERLGVPLNTLYSRLRLGRRRLRETLLALEAGPPEAAPREAAARTWAAIAPAIVPSMGKASVLGSIGAWWLVPAAAVVGVGLVAIAPVPEPAPTTVIVERAVEPPVPPVVTPVVTPARSPPVVAVAPAPTAAPVIAPTTSPVRASANVSPDAGAIGDEAALVRAALSAIDRGDAVEALARLREHETRFGDGALAIERRAARVRALCLAGKRAQARGEAQTLSSDHPQAPAAIAVRDACPVTDRPASGEP